MKHSTIVSHQEHIEDFRTKDGLRSKLRPGDRIRLEYPHGGSSVGVVDEHTADFSVVWIHLDHGQGRTMLLADDQIRIVKQPSAS